MNKLEKILLNYKGDDKDLDKIDLLFNNTK